MSERPKPFSEQDTHFLEMTRADKRRWNEWMGTERPLVILAKPAKREKRAPKPIQRTAGKPKRKKPMNRTTRVKKRSAKRGSVERLDAAWAMAVKERAENACEICGLGGQIDAHHIFGKKANPKLRWALENGVGLTRDCHEWAHRNPLLLQAWIQTWAPGRWARLEAARLG